MRVSSLDILSSVKNCLLSFKNMQFSSYLLLFLLAITPTSNARKSPERVRLSDVKALTLRKDLKTSHNRVSAIPQLNCIGGTAKGLYEIDVLRCKNAGSSYGDEDVQWTCTASLPAEFKLGSTDVICEGFSSSEDPYVLKGSCGVEYRLMLTKLGGEKYGRKGEDMWAGYGGRSKGGDWAAIIFWFLLIAVVGWMMFAALIRDRPGRRPRGAAPNPWFRGGGGGGGDGNNDDPPPPYEYRPSPKIKANSSRAPGAAHAQAQRGWRPGFWSGALGGAAAGYMAGNRGQSQQQRNQPAWNFNGVNGHGSGEEGSSFARAGAGRTSSSESSSSNSRYGSSRHESSGFGGTSRR